MKLRPIVNLLLTAATASLLGSCAMDDIIQQYTGTEIAFRPSLGLPGARSAEVGIGQIKDTELLVTAIDQHGDTYFKDVVFRNDDPDSPTPLFTSDQKYYWPGDGSPLRFTAYPKSYADRGLIDPNTGTLTYKPMSSWYKDEIYTPSGDIILPDGTQISTDKTVHLPDGEIIDPDGTVHFEGNAILYPDGTLNIEGGIIIDSQRNITLLNGTHINKYGNATFPCGATMDKFGSVTLADGTALTRNEDGSATLPCGIYLPPSDATGVYIEDLHGNVQIKTDGTVVVNSSISIYADRYTEFDASSTSLYLEYGVWTIWLPSSIEIKLGGDISNYGENITITADREVDWVADHNNAQGHEDIIVAHAIGTKDNIAGLPLTFKHLLSQIEVWAINNNPAYKYEIVNVKIARVVGSGTKTLADDSPWNLDPDYIETYKPEIDFNARYVTRMGPSVIHHTIALPDGVRTSLTDPNPYYATEVEGTPAGARYGSMMVLPQQLTAWNTTSDDYTGTYLAVKLRIYTEKTAWVYPEKPEVYIQGDQPFGWVAVPLGGTWQAGKRYVYTLDFSDGAGYSDPEDCDPHPVLNGKFKFTLNVSDWDTGGSVSGSYPIE